MNRPLMAYYGRRVARWQEVQAALRELDLPIQGDPAAVIQTIANVVVMAVERADDERPPT